MKDRYLEVIRLKEALRTIAYGVAYADGTDRDSAVLAKAIRLARRTLGDRKPDPFQAWIPARSLGR